MKHLTSLVFGMGIAALTACSAAPMSSEEIASSENAASGSATLTITSDWGAGYCANVVLTNALSVSTTRWQVLIDFKGLAIPSAPWNTTFQTVSGKTYVNAHPMSYNSSIGANGTTSFGFCGNSTAGGVRPSVVAYNMEIDSFPTCQTSSGKNPAKAALAVAMATELGRWEPDQDLTISNGKVALSSTAVCVQNSCKNVKAILGQQDFTADQTIFNNTDFSQDLQSSFQRQKDLMADLNNNHKSSIPISNYKLTQVAGPVNLGIGACGPHYVYQVDYSSGTYANQPVSATDAANLEYTLCFFGGVCSYGGSASNPYIGLVKTGLAGCPSGKMCIAIDPTDGDNGSLSTTTAGSAPTYPFNRVYNPDNSLLGTSCITTLGLYGVLTSKCATAPNTCGYLYCIAQ